MPFFNFYNDFIKVNFIKKTVFKTSIFTLSKLAEKEKLGIKCDFGICVVVLLSFIQKNKIDFFFVKNLLLILGVV
jgi:hypothetical protein